MGTAPSLVMLAALAGLACRATTATAPAETAAPPPAAAAEEGPAGPSLGAVGLDRIVEDLFQELERDPRFQAAGDRLVAQLGEDPRLAKLGEGIVERMAETPVFEQWVAAELARGTDSAQLEAVMDSRVDEVFEHRGFSAAMDEALEALADRPEVDRAVEAWAAAVTREGHVEQALASVFLLPPWRAAWVKILGRQASDAAFLSRVDRYLQAPEGEWAAQINGGRRRNGGGELRRHSQSQSSD